MRYLDSGKIVVDDLFELREIVKDKKIDLSLIDIKASELTSLDFLFQSIDEINGDISDWNISDITSLNNTFYDSKIQPDLSKWNTYKVINMSATFYRAEFNGDISKWDLSNVKIMHSMFYKSKFNGDISQWNIPKVIEARWMFYFSKFDGDISEWYFNKEVNCAYIVNGNKNFEKRYNEGNEIPNDSKGFLDWFKNNKDKMHEINNLNKTDIDNYISSFDLKEVKK